MTWTMLHLFFASGCFLVLIFNAKDYEKAPSCVPCFYPPPPQIMVGRRKTCLLCFLILSPSLFASWQHIINPSQPGGRASQGCCFSPKTFLLEKKRERERKILQRSCTVGGRWGGRERKREVEKDEQDQWEEKEEKRGYDRYEAQRELFSFCLVSNFV